MSDLPANGAPGASQPRDLQPGKDNLVRSAGIVSVAVFLSRITGLVRETVIAQLFGASSVTDAYQLGFRIPNLTRDLFAEGALSSAFVPTFTDYLTTRSRREAAHLANLVATTVILIVGAMCVLGIFFSPAIVSLFGSGLKQDPAKFELAVQLTRIMFPFLLLVSLAAQAMGVLNACNQFGVPALASVWFNVGSVIFGVFLGFVAGPYIGISHIEGIAYGVVLGGMMQLLSQVPSLRRAGFSFRPALDFAHPGLRHILKLMGPAIIGNAAVQVNVLVNTNFATWVRDPVRGLDGPVTWLQAAFRFMQLPLGLFGVAIASATLPSISRSAASKNIDEFRGTLAHSLGTVLLLTVPSSVGLAIISDSVIGLIFQGPRFFAYDTQQTARALGAYAVGLAGYSAVKVLAPAFYTLGSSRTPMVISLVSILINFVVAYTMFKHSGMGHAGLALATSGVAIFNALALFWLLRGRLGGIHGRALLSSTLKIGAASVAMAVLVWFSSHTLIGWLGPNRLGRFVDLAVSIPLGAAAFYAVCRLLKVSELETAVRAIAGSPLGRVLKLRSNGRRP